MTVLADIGIGPISIPTPGDVVTALKNAAIDIAADRIGGALRSPVFGGQPWLSEIEGRPGPMCLAAISAICLIPEYEPLGAA